MLRTAPKHDDDKKHIVLRHCSLEGEEQKNKVRSDVWVWEKNLMKKNEVFQSLFETRITQVMFIDFPASSPPLRFALIRRL